MEETKSPEIRIQVNGGNMLKRTIESFKIERLGGSDFVVDVEFSDGTKDRILAGTSGKIDRILMNRSRFNNHIEVFFSGKGFKRGMR